MHLRQRKLQEILLDELRHSTWNHRLWRIRSPLEEWYRISTKAVVPINLPVAAPIPSEEMIIPEGMGIVWQKIDKKNLKYSIIFLHSQLLRTHMYDNKYRERDEDGNVVVQSIVIPRDRLQRELLTRSEFDRHTELQTGPKSTSVHVQEAKKSIRVVRNFFCKFISVKLVIFPLHIPCQPWTVPVTRDR